MVIPINFGVDISTFPARIDQRKIQLKKGLNLLNQNVVRQVVRRIVRETPVDTGKARSNWIVTRGSPSVGTREPHSPIPKFTDPTKFRERRNADQAMRAAEPAIKRFRPGDQEGSVLWISNNLNYITLLNQGWSKRQQPVPQYVERAVREGVKLGFRVSKGFLFAKGRIVTARKVAGKF